MQQDKYEGQICVYEQTRKLAQPPEDRKMDKTELGDRMKLYEGRESTQFMPMAPICVRLDGRGFSRFTKGMRRPYDERMMEAMQNTCKFLTEQSNASVGYTQSDEITLIWNQDSPRSEIFFCGKQQKMVSVLASLCTLRFNMEVMRLLPEFVDRLPVFDARAWQVPSLKEASNVLLWREQDATKNSIQMAARELYSHKQLMHKNGKEMQAMMLEKDVNWNDYPATFKRGTYFRRVRRERTFTPEELKNLPPKHEAHNNPDLKVLRSGFEQVTFGPLSKMDIDARLEVLFGDPS